MALAARKIAPRKRNAPRPAWKVCPFCNASFAKNSKESWSQWEARATCSYSCAKSKPVRDRLLARISKRPGPLDTDCWVWTGPLAPGGYGRLIVKRGGQSKHWRAHRLSYRAFVGELGELLVCHRCDMPACINPEHLFLGTSADNAADRHSKGRDNAPRGPQKPSTKLTVDDVKEILAGGSATALAREKNVSVSLIYKIRQGKAWDWLDV